MRVKFWSLSAILLLPTEFFKHLLPEIEVHTWHDKYIMGVEVFLSFNRPYYVKKLGSEKGVFVRIGSTNRIADDGLIAELQRSARNEPYDENPMPELSSEDIDFRVASE